MDSNGLHGSMRVSRSASSSSRRRGAGKDTATAYPGLAHAVSEREVTYEKGFVLAHAMSNNHPTSDDKHYELTFMGSVSSSSALPGGLILADYGKSWKASDTGNLWTWTGTAWKDQGPRPAYNEIGKKYWNPDDYWVKHFMAPCPARAGQDDELFLGEQRDMPAFVPRHGGTVDEYYIHNAKKVIREAINAGVDGFTLHMPQIGETSTHWPRTKRYLRAAEQVMSEDGVQFLSMLMPDCKTSATASVKINATTVDINASADALADQILTVKNSPGILRIDGKFVLSAFGAELWPDWADSMTAADRIPFWTRVINRIEANGVPVFFAPTFLGTWTNFASVSGWNAIVDLYSTWGDRDPTTLAGDNVRNRRAAGTCKTNYNKEYMFSVAPGDFRTRDAKTVDGVTNYGVIWENGGFDALDQSWKDAIGLGSDPSLYRKSKIAHYVTWDDYGEHSHMGHSIYNGLALADYGRYWLEWYKTGSEPIILRDVLYLRHRIQPYSGVSLSGAAEAGTTSPLIPHKKPIGSRSDAIKGNTPIRNEVNIRALLKEAAKVEVLFDGVVAHAQECGKGLNRIVTPLKSGIVSVRAIRAGLVTAVVASDAKISMTSRPFQDLYERTFSSERQK